MYYVKSCDLYEIPQPSFTKWKFCKIEYNLRINWIFTRAKFPLTFNCKQNDSSKFRKKIKFDANFLFCEIKQLFSYPPNFHGFMKFFMLWKEIFDISLYFMKLFVSFWSVTAQYTEETMNKLNKLYEYLYDFFAALIMPMSQLLLFYI
jgi:hypothetical protein